MGKATSTTAFNELFQYFIYTMLTLMELRERNDIFDKMTVMRTLTIYIQRTFRFDICEQFILSNLTDC